MKKLVLLLCFLSSWSIAWACICFGPDHFCETFAWNEAMDFPFPDHIIYGKVLSIESTTMDVMVKEVLSGTYEKDTIVVLGSNGVNCNQSLEVFNEADEVILAVFNLDPSNSIYDLIHCGHYFLHVVADKVVGQITEGVYSMDFDEFKEEQLPYCMSSEPVSATEKQESASFNIWPNPVQNNLFLEGLDAAQEYELIIACPTGQITLRRKVRGRFVMQLNTSQLPDGLYLLQLQSKAVVFTRKFIVKKGG